MDINVVVNHPASQALMSGLGVFFAECEKYSWLGSATNFVNVPFIDEKIVPIAAATGMQLTVIKVRFPIGMLL
jgi:hypothetical protein